MSYKMQAHFYERMMTFILKNHNTYFVIIFLPMRPLTVTRADDASND